MKKLLVVDDDIELASMISEFLGGHGFVIESEQTASQGIAAVRAGTFELVILDVMLPDMDGFEMLKVLREKSEIPVIMLSARGERGDRVRGLNIGADDYLPKPFFPDELLARVLAILRRAPGSSSGPQEAVEIGDLRLLPETREAFFAGKPLDLTAMEYEILDRLARNSGSSVSRDQLSLQLYGREASPYERAVDTHVSRIRRKLGNSREIIMSVRGVGYHFCSPTR